MEIMAQNRQYSTTVQYPVEDWVSENIKTHSYQEKGT
jgi:hypothetical protein